MTTEPCPPEGGLCDRELDSMVADIALRLCWIGAWPNALERHAALEDVGAVFGPALASAMVDADVARAALGHT